MVYKKIKKLMDENGISAYQLAKDLGFGTATLSDWKYGKYQPKIDKLVKIADYFDVDVNYFYGTGKRK